MTAAIFRGDARLWTSVPVAFEAPCPACERVHEWVTWRWSADRGGSSGTAYEITCAR